MSSNPLVQLLSEGQSVWLDQMRRSLLTTGELKRLIDNDGLRGLTSNPTIFQKAISGSQDYADQLQTLAKKGAGVSQIYEELVVQDIGNGADVFRGVYDSSHGVDGFVSLEVSPLLANDTQATIEEAKTLFARLNRPNVMIKVPATPAGLPAIEELIASGLNINVTLIFSIAVYEKVAEAYIRGLERREAAGQPVDKIGSVASFFVSRIDTLVDKQLEELAKKADDQQKQLIGSLLGKTAIANAKLAYESFQRIFHGDRFAKLKAKGAKVQRPLWASTSTKNPNYPDTLYVDTLIGPDTVNTMPPETLEHFRDHGKVKRTLDTGLEDAKKVFADLKSVGIDMAAVTKKLTDDGVKSFADSFNELISVIEARRDEVMRQIVARHQISLGSYQGLFNDALKELDKKHFTTRMWQKDAKLWKDDAAHEKIITNALGWLRVAETMLAQHADELVAFAAEICKAGFEYAVVLGMGGSSLCPEVLSRTFGKQQGYPQLLVLDSTVPAAVLALEQKIDVVKTLFIVASKSGTTTEPQVFHRYFYDRVKQVKGSAAGENFVAITDPGTQLVKDAERDKFRRTFLNMADIGGRYSALSFFGMVPFAVMGGEVKTLLQNAVHAMHASAGAVTVAENPGARLGAAIGALARAGRDKLTFVTPKPIDSVGLWIEQLIAESTGKEGKGIVPVAGEALGSPDVYGNDRVFVYIHTKNGADGHAEAKLAALEKAGHPVLRHTLNGPIDLGEEFFLWEFATAVAGGLLGIDAFDQPNVQESKDNTKRLLGEYISKGSLSQQEVIVEDSQLRIFGDAATRDELRKSGKSLQDIVSAHLSRVKAGDYFAITQYIGETQKNEAVIQEIRLTVRDEKKVATTTGYGPRFLHSTGQLHKGGPDSGVFVQITSADAKDVPIPGEKFTFGVLKQAQALGDFESLSNRHRRAIRVDLGTDVESGLERLLFLIRDAVAQTAEAGVRKYA